MKTQFIESSKKLQESGKAHRFQKGHKPGNKGKKWSEYMSTEAQRNALKTTFTKGHEPHNAIPVGGIVIRRRKDRNDPPYKMIKLEGNRKLVFLHKHIWEQAKGKVPKGFNVVFKDKDMMNCELSNLELVSNSELMKRNSGSINLPDRMVAAYLSGSKNTRDYGLMEELKKRPELLELKRQQLLLNREINKRDERR